MLDWLSDTLAKTFHIIVYTEQKSRSCPMGTSVELCEIKFNTQLDQTLKFLPAFANEVELSINY
jgi:hypothetical protein